LAFYGLIPEYVPATLSVTMGRPVRWETAYGVFAYRHIQRSYFTGYQRLDLGGGQQAYVATPEKAFLDLVYLQAGADAPEYLRELRLQNLAGLDLDALKRLVEKLGRPKLRRAASWIMEQALREAAEYEVL
jgi:hypothetical protein